jgi:hypothetical protein
MFNSSNKYENEFVQNCFKDNKLDKFINKFDKNFNYIESKPVVKYDDIRILENDNKEKIGWETQLIKKDTFNSIEEPNENESFNIFEQAAKQISEAKQETTTEVKIDKTKYSGSLLDFSFKCPFFVDLFKIFVQFFTAEVIYDNEYKLNESQEDVFAAFLKRRFNSNLKKELLNNKNCSKIEIINMLIKNTSHKRPEECYKYILIRTIKSLKKELAKSVGVTSFEDEFIYKYYFKEKAQELKIDIKEFYYPFMKKAKKEAKLNSSYFDKIKLSSKFVADSQIYLDNFLFNDHLFDVEKKMISFLKPYDLRLFKSPSEEKNVINSLISYILKNSHCKFPWTKMEIQESANRFRNLLLN